MSSIFREFENLLLLINILKRNKSDYFFWLLGYLGGIIITLLSYLTIWIIHSHWGIFRIECEVFLMTGTVILAVTGLSHLRFQKQSNGSIKLHFLIAYSWPILLMVVYGLLISIGFAKSPRNGAILYIICIGVCVVLFIWSSIIWLHEQGLRKEQEEEPQPSPIDNNLKTTTTELPKRPVPKEVRN